MRQEEIDARDIRDDRDANPVVETELGDIATRRTFKNGTTDWAVEGTFSDCVYQDAMEDAYSMGVAAMEREHPFRRPDEPLIHLESYNKGHIEGWNEGYVEGYRDARDKAFRKATADINALVAEIKGE